MFVFSFLSAYSVHKMEKKNQRVLLQIEIHTTQKNATLHVDSGWFSQIQSKQQYKLLGSAVLHAKSLTKLLLAILISMEMKN